MQDITLDIDQLPKVTRGIVQETNKECAIYSEHSINEILAFSSFGSSLLHQIIDPLSMRMVHGNNYYITVAETGARKSYLQSILKEPLENLEKECIARYRLEFERWKTEITKVKTSNKHDAWGDIQTMPIKPANTAFIFSDVTQEGVFQCLHDGNLPIGFFLSAEGAEFFASSGMTLENSPKVYSMLNGLWSGEQISSVRAGFEGKKMIPRGARVSCNLALQKSAFEQYIATPYNMAVGFTSRLLISTPQYPQPTTAKQRKLAAMQRSTTNLIALRDKITQHAQLTIDHFIKNRQTPAKTLKLNKKAEKYYCIAYDNIQKEMQNNGTYYNHRGFANKLPEHILRLCIALHFIENKCPDNNTITPNIIQAAIHLGEDFYMQNHIRLINKKNLTTTSQAI